MRIPKCYGAYKTNVCPFCERTATHKNPQGLEVCRLHVDKNLEEIRCLCGSWLELKVGKFGPYFNCIKCGNRNFKKVMEIKELTKDNENSSHQASFRDKRLHTEIPVFKPSVSYKKIEEKVEVKQEEKKEYKGRQETVITPNDVEYFD